MNRRMKFLAVVFALTALLTLPPFVAIAQEELTLAGVAEQIESLKTELDSSVSLLTIAGRDRAEAVSILSGKVNSIVERVVALEDVMFPKTFTTDDGYCRVGLSNRLHPTTLAEYLRLYPDESLPDTIWITAVWTDPHGDMAVVYETYPHGQYITEYWSDCEFLEYYFWADSD